jgi:hypothetical protein
MTMVRRLWADQRAASAAEFAIVLPLFLILLFGTIDAARFVWEYNRAEKATQVGARLATVTDPLSSGLIEEDYAGQTVDGETIGAGELIPAGALGVLKCTSADECVCESGTCPDPGTFDSDTFNDVIVARMKQIYPAIEAENVEVRYKGSGFGYAGSAAGGGGGGGGGAAEIMEISPLITVTLTGLQFRPITALLLAEMSMPSFSTTLTAEDASGQYSN